MGLPKNTCYDCGCLLTKDNRTRDHIPPKGLFPNSLRNDDLIKVPCCYKCNQAHKGEDELLMYLAADRRASISSAPIADKISRALRNDKSLIRRSFEEVIQSARGVEGNPDIDISIPIKSKKLMSRMVKGLLYDRCGIRNFDKLTFHEDEAMAAERELYLDQAKDLAHSITKGHDIFRADWIIVTDQPDYGMWWIELFGWHITRIIHHGPEPFRRCTLCG